jgi:hypothetical protein
MNKIYLLGFLLFFIVHKSACCIDFEIDSYSVAQGSHSWQLGNSENPFNVLSGSIYVKTELRLSAGSVLSLNNITLRFAPNAKLIIEEGNGNAPGAKLILNNSILSDDNRCDSNVLWLGVEIWGSKKEDQGSVLTNGDFNNSQQGHLVMKNRSVIENAKIGVLVSSRLPGSIVYLSHSDKKTGGIINALEKSKIRNCEYGLWADSYGPNNSLSHFKDCFFSWTDENHFKSKDLSTMALAKLARVNNYQFTGCTFENTSSGVLQKGKGVGLWVNTSLVIVNALPTCISYPCEQFRRGLFSNFQKGIFFNSMTTFKLPFLVDRQDFNNCSFGVESNNATNNQITLCNFYTRELFGVKTAGIVLHANTGYRIEENYLSQNNDSAVAFADGRVYGIVVSNSGSANNEIYKNTFKDLYIGGQSELDNSPREKDSLGNWVSFNPNAIHGGLRWVCNNFQDLGRIEMHDLIVVNGDIAYLQENIDQVNPATDDERRKRSANNKFSLINETLNLEHDISVDINSAGLNYRHLADERLIPDSRTTSGQNRVLNFIVQDQAGNPLFSNGTECPSKLHEQISGNVEVRISQLVTDVQEMKHEMDANSTSKPELYYDIFTNEDLILSTKEESFELFNSPLNHQLVLTLSMLNIENEESSFMSSAILGAQATSDLYFDTEYSYRNPVILDPILVTNSSSLISLRSKLKQMQFFPNPSSGIVNIDFTEHMDGEMKIEVIDVKGKVQHVSTRAKANAEQMDFTDLEKGIYLIRVTIAQEVVGIERWIKQ